VRRIEAGESLRRVQQPGEGRYYSAPQAADIARFGLAGLRLFDGAEFESFTAQRQTTHSTES
jgi:hypothetical protein